MDAKAESRFEITPEIVAEHGLSPGEYQRLLKILGREPSYTELGIFSVMWSRALLLQILARVADARCRRPASR